MKDSPKWPSPKEVHEKLYAAIKLTVAFCEKQDGQLKTAKDAKGAESSFSLRPRRPLRFNYGGSAFSQTPMAARIAMIGTDFV